jgi:hypothetical protein
VLKVVDSHELASEVADAEREVLLDTDVLPGPPEPPSVQMYVRCLTGTGETLKHCTSLEKVIFFSNQRSLKIRFNGTGRYHGTMSITVKELKKHMNKSQTNFQN